MNIVTIVGNIAGISKILKEDGKKQIKLTIELEKETYTEDGITHNVIVPCYMEDPLDDVEIFSISTRVCIKGRYRNDNDGGLIVIVDRIVNL
ncbi:MAG: hypothetical protein J6T15_04870 [Bacilli bacterium]|nr:hypothetical protein [Bacilli bacterium]